MKGPGRRLRLSPNEEARIIKEEKERRRKLRLVQVREQAKVNAATIRHAVKQEREIQINLLRAEIKAEWEEEKAEKVRKLQEIHLRSLKHVGDAHVNASQQEPTDVERALIEQQNLQRAAQRHLDAIRKMKEDKKKKDEEANKHIVARQKALEQEKERAAEVAAMPPTESDPLQNIEVPKVKPIKLTDLNAFSLTHYHMEDYAVERAQLAELADARQAAEEEQERIETIEEAEKISAHERQEKARLRHKHAREKVLLKQDYDHMLLDLSDLRRTDISRRQQVVAKIPRAVYQAPHRRIEEKEEEQREMEAAFEDMYMAVTEHQGDLTLALDPHPPPTMTPAESTALDLSMDPSEVDRVLQGQKAPLQDLTNIQRLKSRTNVAALGKLMSRINAQRESWSKQPSSQHADSPPNMQPLFPVEPDVSSTATGPSLTQYTLTSGGLPSVTATTLEDSSMDASSTSTMTSSKVSSVPSSRLSVATTGTDSDTTTITATTEGTLEEGTVSSSSMSSTMQTDSTDTLLHPMELAAKVRHRPLNDGTAPMSSFLEDRTIGIQPNLEQMVRDFRQEQQQLEKERKKIEQKIKGLEETSIKPTPLELAQKYLHELPPNPPAPTRNNLDTGVPSITTPISSSLSRADKVRLYQQRALERSGRSSTLGRSLDSRSTLTKTPSPERSPKYKPTNNSSVMTSPGMLSSISGGYPMDISNTQTQQDRSGLTDLSSQQSYHSQEFDARQAALKVQLAEIEREKMEMMAREKQHQADMSQTRERWQRELEQYSNLSQGNVGQRSLSLIEAEPQQNDEFDEDDMDEDLLRQLNDLPLKSIDHKYKIQRQKPTQKAIKVPNKSPVMPHELSTIQEMDTPLTDKKRLNSTELDNRRDRGPVARSLFDNQMQAVPEVDASHERGIPEPLTLIGQGQYEEGPKTPQQMYQHFTKVPSEVDTLSAGRSDDYSDTMAESWNRAALAGLEEYKTLELPAPSTDQVVEIQRLPYSTAEELVVSPRAEPEPAPPVQDFRDLHDDHTGLSSMLSTGRLTDDIGYHPDSTGITIDDKATDRWSTGVDKSEPTDRIPAHRYMSTHSRDETPPRGEPQASPRTGKPYSPSSPHYGVEFNSHYQPLKDQKKDKSWKKELAQYNLSYLTEPKTSPARPTDKIVRCITTRAFGCERPIKGTAKTKQEMEERHRANLLPPRDTREEAFAKIKSPEENMSPSRIRQMFEAATGPMGSPIPKDKPSHGLMAQNGQFLASTPSSGKAQSRLVTDDMTPPGPVDRQTMEGRPSNFAMSDVEQRLRHTPSFTGTITPSERSSQSELSQQRLDSDADTTKTPANASIKTDGSLEQFTLSATASAGRETTISLSQYTLEDSRRVSNQDGSFQRSVGGPGSQAFQPLMEMSRSSDGSALSPPKYPLTNTQQMYGMDNQQYGSRTGWVSQPLEPMPTGPYPIQRVVSGGSSGSQDSGSGGPSQNVVDLAMDISQKAAAAMEKYDRLMDESRKLRQQYEKEEEVLMAETRTSSQQSSRPSSGAVIERNFNKSLERLAAEETGISEEPDITLVSAASTPQKASPQEPRTAFLEDPLLQSYADSKASDHSASMLSFEQHKQSLVTPSQGSLGQSGGTKYSHTPSTSTSSTAASSLAASGPRLDASRASTMGKEEKPSMVQDNQKHMSRTLASWKKNNALQASGPETLSMTTKTSADHKKKEREMRERTERLYGQNEDVKQQRQDKQRQDEYAANRQRKLDYQKNYQEQLRKKMQDKKP